MESSVLDECLERKAQHKIDGKPFWDEMAVKHGYKNGETLRSLVKHQVKKIRNGSISSSQFLPPINLQNDRKDGDEGLADFLFRVKRNKSKLITYQEFVISDIERCEVVKEVLDLYDDDKKALDINKSESNESEIIDNIMIIPNND